MVPVLNTRVDLFRLLELSLISNVELPEDADITPNPEYMDIDLSVFHDAEKNPDQMFLTTTITYAEEEEHFSKSSYQFRVVAETAISWAGKDEDIDFQSKSILMVIEGFSSAVSIARGLLAQTTALGASGEFILPLVDVQQFIEQHLKEDTQIK